MKMDRRILGMSLNADTKKVPKEGKPCRVDSFIGKTFVVQCIHRARTGKVDTR